MSVAQIIYFVTLGRLMNYEFERIKGSGRGLIKVITNSATSFQCVGFMMDMASLALLVCENKPISLSTNMSVLVRQ
jgi:hypothetical protein